MAIRSLEGLYACYPADTPDGKIAREVIVLSDWLYNSVEFDPVSGDALPQSLSHFLVRLQSHGETNETLHDRLWRIVDYSADAFRRIIRALNEQPKTDHARMHVSRVREMDASSFVKLANRTGRTIREKLGSDPFVTSVRHYQSVDILENRLLKAYALRMEELLESRAKAFDEPESDLLIDIRNWLVSEEAKCISRWDNLPPNNALLSHRDYRRVWKAWRWLQSLDDDVKYDAEHVAEHRQVMSFWDCMARAFDRGCIIADMPLTFEYEVFYIGTNVTEGIIYAKNVPNHIIQIGVNMTIPTGGKTSTRIEHFDSDKPVCIDFTSLRPMWTEGRKAVHLDALLVWQRWMVDGEGFVPVSLADTECIWLNPNASTVTIRDLILPGRIENEVADRAASDFLSILHDRFRSSELVWLVPDCVNEFELSVIRRHINNHYESAQPLPRSLATVIEKIDGRPLRDGHTITVLDALGGRIYATKLIARKCQDAELAKRVPESFGYYWERQPTIVLKEREWTLKERLSSVHVLDENIQWTLPQKDRWLEDPMEIKRSLLDSDERFVGTEIVFADIAPVVGGLLLYERQKRAGDIPLWKDHLPDLDLSASSGTEMIRVHLVSNTTIVPRTGMTFEIPVDAVFTLLAGRDDYTFPLYQGTGSARLRYQARLSAHNAFPLKKNLSCRLVMNYRYGADNPYELKFVPKEVQSDFPKSFLVEWVPITADMLEADAPIPGFPAPISREEILCFGANHVDMFRRLKLGANRLLDYLRFLDGEASMRRHVVLDNSLEWHEDVHGNAYTILRKKGESIFVHQGEFDRFDCNAMELSFDLERGSRGLRAKNITIGYTIPSRFDWARSLLRVPMSIIFSVIRDEEGLRSYNDIYPILELVVDLAAKFYEMDGIDSETQSELLYVLACYNAKVPSSGIKFLASVVNGSRYESWQSFNASRRTIALSIGDCMESWQKNLLKQVLAKTQIDELWASVVYEILAIALWRSKSLIHRLKEGHLLKIFDGLGRAIKKDRVRVEGLASQEKSKSDHRLDAALNTLCKHLELLLALLRTRESGNRRIRRIIMPGTTNAINFESIVGDEVIPLFKKGLWFESRIRLDHLDKPEVFRDSPDLLYALKLYLTGDDGAKSIIVNGISEED